MDIIKLAAALRRAVDKAPYGEKVVTIHLFGIDHERDLRGISLKQLVDAAGINVTYATEINKGMNLAAYVRRK